MSSAIYLINNKKLSYLRDRWTVTAITPKRYEIGCQLLLIQKIKKIHAAVLCTPKFS